MEEAERSKPAPPREGGRLNNGEMIRNRGADEPGALIVVENFFEELKTTVGNE